MEITNKKMNETTLSITPNTEAEKHNNTSSNDHGGSNGVVWKRRSSAPDMPETIAKMANSLDETEAETVMSAQDLSYWARVGCLKRQRKQILHNVTCYFKKGVNIILGPTGSGKTTLLDLLAYRKNPAQSSGQVLMNGRPRMSDFKNRVGYVTQDDVMMGTLTVKESISFSAALRLPCTFSKAEKEKRVNDVIAMLGLDKCANTKIGNDIIRGVSGGERKRCNIGMEMIISPPVLFLDEPTTGLDASTAHSVIRLLKKMSEMGRVIILSIHQPRYSIYQLADTTTMLTAGHLVYYGPPDDAVDFFASQGFVCAQYNNPADFFLDTLADNTVGEDNNTKAGKLIESFKHSRWQADIDNEMQEIARQGGMSQTGVLVREMCGVGGLCHSGYATSWLHQYAVVCKRGLKDVMKNPQITLAMVVKSVLLSTFIGCLFWQLGTSTYRGITHDRTGVLFFLQLTQQFVNISAVNVFISERRLFRHEVCNGYYRVSAYFMAKVTCDLLPLRLLPVAIIVFSTQYSVGLRPGSEHLIVLFTGLYAVCVATACLSFFVGCTVSENETGHIVMSMMMAISNLYAGFLINLSSIPVALSWFQHLSVAKYGFRILMVNEFADRTFTVEGTNQTIQTNAYLDELDIDQRYNMDDILPNFAALAVFGGVMLVLAYVQLRCTKVHS